MSFPVEFSVQGNKLFIQYHEQPYLEFDELLQENKDFMLALAANGIQVYYVEGTNHLRLHVLKSTYKMSMGDVNIMPFDFRYVKFYLAEHLINMPETDKLNLINEYLLSKL